MGKIWQPIGKALGDVFLDRKEQRAKKNRKPIRDKNGKIVGWSETGPSSGKPSHLKGVPDRGNLAKETRRQVRAQQQFLKRQGYNIAADGVMGPQTKSALKDWHKGKGKRNPKAWSGASAPAKARPASGGRGSARPAKAKKQASGPNMAGLAAIGKAQGVSAPVGLAQKLAGLEFDPDIRDLGIERQRQQVQSGQELADIGNWYDQVLASQETARGRNAAAGAAGVSSMRDAVNSIVSSLGGSANEGGGLVAASGLDQVGLLEALGTAQEQYDADVRPILRAEAAGARQRQTAMNQEEAQNIRNQILSLVGQRGQKKAQYQEDLRRYGLERSDRLGQQGFQNALALREAEMAGQSLGLKEAELGFNMRQAMRKPPSGWAALSPADKAAIAADARMSVLGIDPETGQARTQLPKGTNTTQAVQRVTDAYRQYGLAPRNNPAVRAHVVATLRSLGIQPQKNWVLFKPTKRKR